jgi:hypothetical protein
MDVVRSADEAVGQAVSVGYMWIEATREERVRRSEVGGAERWKRA